MALSWTTSVAARGPLFVGAKVTSTWQLVPAATPPLQLFLCGKSCACGPLAAILLTFSVSFPTFVTRTEIALEVHSSCVRNVNAACENRTAGPFLCSDT